MEIETLTAFDITVLVIIGFSTLFAFGRGFTTVALSFGAWIGSLFATVFGFTLAKPYIRDYITPPELADIIGLAAIFFLSLFLLKQIAEWVGGMVKDSPVGLLDRSLGALFGLLRGMVIVSIAYLGFSKIFNEDNAPDWVQNAETRPLVAWGANMVEGFAQRMLGEDTKTIGNDYIDRASKAIPNQFLTDQAEQAAAKYLKDQRKDLEDLISDVSDERDNKDDSGNNN
ncbi:CvpA family protein [Kordiimonas sp. SCSIO 12610]|uniref:CvpA family protein n=1 Tax=Kordiimonas sp. SCSIO 12610 TaxID=2829597 RepID=UPI00210B6E10|nr:CvpA family protein [Kordiimonas sp. SCSIO 12610]UTW54099.1 CvpA family protein [Kordiimonas sp. SCSIO 12610]